MLTKLIKGKSSLIILDQAIVSAGNFTLTLLLARFLNLNEFGLFSLIWLFVLFFSSIQNAVIISPMLTLGGKKEKLTLNRFLHGMLLIEVLYLSGILVILLLLSIFLHFLSLKEELAKLIPFFSLATLSFLLNEFYRRYFIIQGKLNLLITIDIIAYIGQIALILIISIKNSLNLKWAFISIFVAFTLSNFVSYTQTLKTRIGRLYLKQLTLKIWNFSKWLLYSALLQWGSGNFFIIVASSVLGNWTVGVIKATQNIMGILHVIFISLENILPTKFSQIYKKSGYIALISVFKKLIKVGIILSVLFILIIVLLAPKIMTILYGEKYAQFSYLLIGFAIVYLLIYINMLQRYVIRTIEKTKTIFISYVITTIFSIISSYPLIKWLGLNGVIIGMVAVQILTYIFLYKEIKQRGL